MELSTLLQYGLQFLVAVPAIVFHEVAHGYAALYLGDPTAKNEGRLSLNPLKHIDPFGTIILPLLMIVALGAGFGYAKPVPVNPRYFKDYRKGMFITALAGPATNLALAAVAGLLFRIGLSLVSGVGRVHNIHDDRSYRVGGVVLLRFDQPRSALLQPDPYPATRRLASHSAVPSR